jgi:hypothetical protein
MMKKTGRFRFRGLAGRSRRNDLTVIEDLDALGFEVRIDHVGIII